MNLPRTSSRRRRAFSLVEMMVAVAVLAVVGLIIAQMINLITQGTKISTSSVDAASQARLVFDRIGLDLDALVKRTDVDFQINNDVYATANDDRVPLMSFLSQVSSPDPSADYANRGISLLSYTVEPHAENEDRLCLVRAAKAISWNMPEFIGLKDNGLPTAFTETAFPVQLAVADADILSPSVIQAVVGLQLYPDDEPVYFPGDTTPTLTNSRGEIVYEVPVRGPASGDPDNPNPANSYADLDRVASIVVGLVVIDLESLVLLDADMTSDLAAAFDQVPAVNELPVETWLQANGDLALDALKAKLPDVPQPALQSIRVYQRFYPVNPYGSRSQ